MWCAVVPGQSARCAVEPDLLPTTFLRSAAKPFQLVPLVVAGGMERFALDAADLAVMAASHDGTEAHAARVEAILRRMGLGPESLHCGVHRPYFLDDLPAQSPERLRVYGPLHNNCSGNHAAMLGAALLSGVDPQHYLDPRARSQQRVHALVAALSGSEPLLAVDNCAAPCYGMGLDCMARAYEALARPARVRDLAPATRARLAAVGDLGGIEAALDRIADAMAREPAWVSGAGSGATRLAESLPGELVAKHGAEGILCLAHRRQGTAVALKVADGNARALLPAAISLVADLGWLDAPARAALADVASPVLRGRVGQVVGRLQVAG